MAAGAGGEAGRALERLAADDGGHPELVLPQLCVRSDLRSARRQWGLDEPAALLQEHELGMATIVSGETLQGAARFAAGAGRHGEGV